MTKKVISQKHGIGIIWDGYTHPVELLLDNVVPVFWGITIRSVFFGVMRFRIVGGDGEPEVKTPDLDLEDYGEP